MLATGFAALVCDVDKAATVPASGYDSPPAGTSTPPVKFSSGGDSETSEPSPTGTRGANASPACRPAGTPPWFRSAQFDSALALEFVSVASEAATKRKLSLCAYAPS